MGENGDREPYFWIFQFREDEVEPQIVALSETKLGRITESLGFVWYTTDGSPPKDVPPCGYFNELCIVEENDNGLIIAVSTVGVMLPAVVVIVIFFVLRKRKQEAELLQSIWKININEIDIQKSMTIFGSRIRNRSPSIAAESRVLSECGTHASLVDNGIFTTVAMFRGQMVSVRTIRRCEVHSKADLYELKTMREMVHENVNPFLGACFDAPTPCAVFSFCHKGSLQDILENDEIKLDSTFKSSMTLDLVQMKYFILAVCLFGLVVAFPRGGGGDQAEGGEGGEGGKQGGKKGGPMGGLVKLCMAMAEAVGEEGAEKRDFDFEAALEDICTYLLENKPEKEDEVEAMERMLLARAEDKQIDALERIMEQRRGGKKGGKKGGQKGGETEGTESSDGKRPKCGGENATLVENLACICAGLAKMQEEVVAEARAIETEDDLKVSIQAMCEAAKAEMEANTTAAPAERGYFF
ncbi:hypothetical protein ACF0H5_017036 [Mactra antiquata]